MPGVAPGTIVTTASGHIPVETVTVGMLALAGDSKDPTKLPPEISRSGGVTGGVVLLWPRVIPRSEDPQTDQDAAFVQGQLRAAIARALPGRPVDVRPNPERVCPRAGCAG